MCRVEECDCHRADFMFRVVVLYGLDRDFRKVVDPDPEVVGKGVLRHEDTKACGKEGGP